MSTLLKKLRPKAIKEHQASASSTGQPNDVSAALERSPSIASTASTSSKFHWRVGNSLKQTSSVSTFRPVRPSNGTNAPHDSSPEADTSLLRDPTRRLSVEGAGAESAVASQSSHPFVASNKDSRAEDLSSYVVLVDRREGGSFQAGEGSFASYPPLSPRDSSPHSWVVDLSDTVPSPSTGIDPSLPVAPQVITVPERPQIPSKPDHLKSNQTVNRSPSLEAPHTEPKAVSLPAKRVTIADIPSSIFKPSPSPAISPDVLKKDASLLSVASERTNDIAEQPHYPSSISPAFSESLGKDSGGIGDVIDNSEGGGALPSTGNPSVDSRTYGRTKTITLLSAVPESPTIVSQHAFSSTSNPIQPGSQSNLSSSQDHRPISSALPKHSIADDEKVALSSIQQAYPRPNSVLTVRGPGHASKPVVKDQPLKKPPSAPDRRQNPPRSRRMKPVRGDKVYGSSQTYTVTIRRPPATAGPHLRPRKRVSLSSTRAGLGKRPKRSPSLATIGEPAKSGLSGVQSPGEVQEAAHSKGLEPVPQRSDDAPAKVSDPETGTEKHLLSMTVVIVTVVVVGVGVLVAFPKKSA